MTLKDVMSRPAYQHMERFVNQRHYSTFCEYSEVDERFKPKSGADSFELPVHLVPRDQIDIYTDNPPHDLMMWYDSDVIPFPVHPDVPPEHLRGIVVYPAGKPVRAVPTACTRTVLALDHDAGDHFLKLHMPRRISRFNRRLRPSSVRHSIDVSQDLEDVDYGAFAYLPESMGLVYGGANGFGCIVREMKPRPHQEGRALIPYFALYSIDEKAPEEKPLLVQMINREGANPETFVAERILIPLIACWCATLKQRGVLLESHGQNTMLEVDTALTPRRVVHRDFQSTMIDPSVRQVRGLDVPFTKHVIGVDGLFPREQEYSLVYDYLMGHHLLDSVANVLPRYYGTAIDGVRERCREAFHHLVPDASAFPPTTFQYVDRPFPDNIPEL